MHGMLEQQESSIQKAAPGNCLGSLQTLTVLIKKPGHQQESFLLFDAEPALATAPLRFSPPPSGLAHTADLSSGGGGGGTQLWELYLHHFHPSNAPLVIL